MVSVMPPTGLPGWGVGGGVVGHQNAGGYLPQVAPYQPYQMYQRVPYANFSMQANVDFAAGVVPQAFNPNRWKEISSLSSTSSSMQQHKLLASRSKIAATATSSSSTSTSDSSSSRPKTVTSVASKNQDSNANQRLEQAVIKKQAKKRSLEADSAVEAKRQRQDMSRGSGGPPKVRGSSSAPSSIAKSLFVDCSVEYELPNIPKIPNDGQRLLVIHPRFGQVRIPHSFQQQQQPQQQQQQQHKIQAYHPSCPHCPPPKQQQQQQQQQQQPQRRASCSNTNVAKKLPSCVQQQQQPQQQQQQHHQQQHFHAPSFTTSVGGKTTVLFKICSYYATKPCHRYKLNGPLQYFRHYNSQK